MNKIFKTIYNIRVPIIAGGISCFVIWRFNKNFNDYARAASKEKVYDVRRATEQLNLYRELYNPDKDVMENKNKEKENISHETSGPNKLLSMASEEDKTKLKEIFNEYDNMDADEIKKQISKVKKQIELLEERKTSHQGIKLSRVMYGYEPSEEALKKIREHYKDNKQKENK